LKKQLQEIFRASIELQQDFVLRNLDVLEEAIETIAKVLSSGNKLLFFGNGGSAADAQHLAAEFVNRYLIDRPPLPAIALTTDSSVLTAISNDFGYELAFEKQIQALGQPGDAAIGISTSGTSANVIKGLAKAREMGLVTIGIGGNKGTPMQEVCDHYLGIEGGSTPRIQEVHHLLGHAMVEMVDRKLFG
jgi:D-sedoheptulose 7-phosphate isomerase